MRIEKPPLKIPGGCYGVAVVVERLDLPGSALIAIEPFIGFVIANEPFGLWIPLKPAVIPIGKVAEVANRYGSATDFDIADWFIAAAHAIEEIFAVIVTLVEPDRFVIQLQIN